MAADKAVHHHAGDLCVRKIHRAAERTPAESLTPSAELGIHSKGGHYRAVVTGDMVGLQMGICQQLTQR